jgi:hypothetical protein
VVPDVEAGPELMPAIRSDRRGVARIEVGIARGEETVCVELWWLYLKLTTEKRLTPVEEIVDNNQYEMNIPNLIHRTRNNLHERPVSIFRMQFSLNFTG